MTDTLTLDEISYADEVAIIAGLEEQFLASSYSGPEPAAYEPTVTPSSELNQSFYHPDPAIPTADPVVTYTGPGIQPTWDDVFKWATSPAQLNLPDLQTPVAVTGPSVQNAVVAGMGSVIKAMSGFINRVANIDVLAANVLAQHIIDTQTVIHVLDQQRLNTEASLLQMIGQIVNQAIPHLEKQIAALHTLVIDNAANVITVMQAWTTENIFNPLQKEFDALHTQMDTDLAKLRADTPTIAQQALAPTIAEQAAAIAALQASMTALQTEQATCVEPMCETVGPNSPFGKLLKALNLAADAAALLAIMDETEAQLVADIKTVVNTFAGFLTDLDPFLNQGATIGSALTTFIGNVV